MYSDSYGVSSPKENALLCAITATEITKKRASGEKVQCTANCKFQAMKMHAVWLLVITTIRAKDKEEPCNTVTFYVCLITCASPSGEKQNLMSILNTEKKNDRMAPNKIEKEKTENEEEELCAFCKESGLNECSQLISEHFLCEISNVMFFIIRVYRLIRLSLYFGFQVNFTTQPQANDCIYVHAREQKHKTKTKIRSQPLAECGAPTASDN